MLFRVCVRLRNPAAIFSPGGMFFSRPIQFRGPSSKSLQKMEFVFAERIEDVLKATLPFLAAKLAAA